MLERLRNIKSGIRYSFVFPLRVFPIYAMITGIGRETISSPEYTWDGLNRGAAEFTIWQYTVSGTGYLDYEGEKFQLTPGKAMILHVPHKHRYYYSKTSTEPWEFLYISMNGREIMRLWNEFESRIGPVVDMRSAIKSVETIEEIFSHAWSGSTEKPFHCSALAYKFMMGLCEDFVKSARGSEDEPIFVKRAADYCLNNIDKDISVADMANAAGYSRAHFCRTFIKYQGKSPSDFLKELRLENSVRLLQNQHFTIKEIALRSGFKDLSYFCKVFKEKFSISPLEYRRAGL